MISKMAELLKSELGTVLLAFFALISFIESESVKRFTKWVIKATNASFDFAIPYFIKALSIFIAWVSNTFYKFKFARVRLDTVALSLILFAVFFNTLTAQFILSKQDDDEKTSMLVRDGIATPLREALDRDVLRNGDIIITDSSATDINLANGQLLYLTPGTCIEFNKGSYKFTSITLHYGSILYDLQNNNY